MRVVVAHRTRHRRSAHLSTLLGLAVTVAAAAVTVSAAHQHPDRGSTSRAVRVAGAPSVAGAYGYPAPCLSITILAAHRNYARADFNRRRPCGRYGGSTTAIMHRVGGEWHLVLDAATYSCPVAGIPLVVQAELAVCSPTTSARERQASPR